MKLSENALAHTTIGEINAPKLKSLAAWSLEHAQIGKAYFPSLESIEEGVFNQANIDTIHLGAIQNLSKSIFNQDSFRVSSVKHIEAPNLVTIEDQALSRLPLETLKAPKLESLGAWSLEYTHLRSLDLPSLKEMKEGALYSSSLEELKADQLEKIGDQALELTKLSSLNLASLLELGESALYEVPLKSLHAPQLKIIGDRALEKTQLSSLDLPSLTDLGVESLAGTGLESLNAPNLEKIGKDALSFNGDLKELKLKKEIDLKNLSLAFRNVGYSSEFFPGYIQFFALHIEDSDAVNEFVEFEHTDFGAQYKFFVINPEGDVNLDFIKKEIDPHIPEGQTYVRPIAPDHPEYNFAMGENAFKDVFYCVDSSQALYPGAYEEIEVEDQIFVLHYGISGEHEQAVAFDDYEGHYVYSYKTSLISKLIYHSKALLGENYPERGPNLIHLITSNHDWQKLLTKDLDEENFAEILKETMLYRYDEDGEGSLISIYGEDFLEELFTRIKNDQREYTNLKYYRPVESDFNVTELNQALIKPGEPINEKINIDVTKKWHGGESLERPEITVHLLRDGEKFKEVKLSDKNDWSHTWEELDKTNSLGEVYEYSVEELEVPGYRAKVSGNVETGFVITNNYEIPKISLTVEKEWKDNGHEKHSEITVYLLRDNHRIDEIVLSASKDWKHVWEDLDKTDSTGREYSYSVEELELEGYVSNVEGDMDSGFKIINTPESPKKPANTKRDIHLSKKWITRENEKLPSITVQLLRNEKIVDEIVLDGSENWEYVWLDLDRFDREGREYVYSVEEIVPNSYTARLEGNMDEGFVLINEYEEIPEEPTTPTPEEPTIITNSKTKKPVPSLPSTGMNSPLLTYSVSILFTGLLLIVLNKKD